MSGSLPHVIALSSHTQTGTVTPGYTTFDLRSDEDTNIAALNARNAKASSDLVVTLSEQGQALSQRNRKKVEDDEVSRREDALLELEEEFIEDDDAEPFPHIANKDSKTAIYQEKIPTGDFLDQIV
ncbi:hypothetical protein HGG82_14545 [Marinomonas sp. M1K-6]|uniref:Uncharacterized protein n=1 Tax=Marinomonas profundi TaxID=2726122 RepID=A0A847R8M7_9GAMM|nr:hypothetical protein [Marinomonas profundi]NLQ18823.1 hypothetical protein [Marinomonas profundi]UDV02971.1 hypothetical protein J8N69_15630 [Marinomonas profundi]